METWAAKWLTFVSAVILIGGLLQVTTSLFPSTLMIVAAALNTALGVYHWRKSLRVPPSES